MAKPTNAEQEHRAGPTTLTDAELDRVGGGGHFGVSITPGSIIRPSIQTFPAAERGAFAASVAQATEVCYPLDPCQDF